MTRPLRRKGQEEGSALVISLVIITVVALLVAGMLSFAEVALKASSTYHAQERSRYAADGAIEAAINRFRLGGPCDDYPAPRGPQGGLNGQPVAVHCDTIRAPARGSATKPSGALLSLGTHPLDDGVFVAGPGPLRVRGDVFSNSGILVEDVNGSLIVEGDVAALGDCIEREQIQAVGNKTAQEPFGVRCGGGGDVVDPARGRDPDFTPALTTPPVLRTVPACPASPAWLVTLLPGYYDDAAALSGLTNGGCAGAVVWLQPGIYYFDFSFGGGPSTTWNINDGLVNVVGGTPRNWDPAAPARPTLPVPGSCKTAEDPGTVEGIQIIVGGASRLDIAGGAKVELCPEPSPTDQSVALHGLGRGGPDHLLTPTATGTVTGFTDANSALTIGELPASGDPDPAGATAVLSAPDNKSASLTVLGFRPAVPQGSVIDVATLRVAHRDTGDINKVTATPAFPGSTCGEQNLPLHSAAVVTDTVDLKACGLVDPSSLAELAVTYAVALGPGGTAGTDRLDGIAVDISYRAPVTRKPTTATTTGFTGAPNAFEIGERPAATADALLAQGGLTSATLTLTGFGDPPLPAGTTIDSAVLRVSHRDDGDIGTLTATPAFPGSTCGTRTLTPHPASTVEDRINLKACGLVSGNELAGFGVTYTVSLAGGGIGASEHLDGIWLDLVYRTQITRPAVTTSTSGFTNDANAKVIDGSTADASVTSATPVASITLSGYDQPAVPVGSVIESATLRVVHRDDGDVGAVTVSVPFAGSLCATRTLPPRAGVLAEDRVDLKSTCGLVLPEQLNGLTMTYTVSLAAGGTSANHRLDGVVIDLVYRPPARHEPVATSDMPGFANPDNARAIDATTADVTLDATTREAAIVLRGFDQPALPAGAVIDSATLRVAHRDEGNVGAVYVTAPFTGSTCGTVPIPLRPAAIVEDTVDLKACGLTTADKLAGLSVSYWASLAAGGGTATDRLDGMALSLTYHVTATRSPVTATSSSFANPNNSKAIDGVTSDATLNNGAPSATLTLTGLDQPAPAASAVIDTAVLRVAHRDEADVGQVQVTPAFPSSTCGTVSVPLSPSAITTDSIDLKACGLTAPDRLNGITVGYTASLASGGAPSVDRVDGVVLDLSYHAAVTQSPGTAANSAAFTNPGAARTVDGVSADAGVSTTGPAAFIRLSGYDQPALPPGARIDTALLRVVHREDAGVGQVTLAVPFNGSTCSAKSIPLRVAAAVSDFIDLKNDCGLTQPGQLAGLSVTYSAFHSGDGAPATEHLDAVVLEIAFRAPSMEPVSGCLIQPASGCALVKTAPANQTRFVAHGTVYAPTAALDIRMDNVDTQVLTRGLIARSIRLRLGPAPGFQRPAAGVPPEAVLFTALPSNPPLNATGTFANPGNAVAIDGVSASAGPAPASMTLDGFAKLPADGNYLVVAHRDGPAVATLTLTVLFSGGDPIVFNYDVLNPAGCGPGQLCAHPSAIGQDRIKLPALTPQQQASTVSVKFEATFSGPGDGESLDGILFERAGPSDALARARVAFDGNRVTVEGWSVLR